MPEWAIILLAFFGSIAAIMFWFERSTRSFMRERHRAIEADWERAMTRFTAEPRGQTFRRPSSDFRAIV